MVQDSSGAQSTATATVTVSGSNDTPVLVHDSFPASADEVFSIPAPGVLQNDSDPDGNVLSVISSDSVSSRGATVQVSPDGRFEYFPNNVPAFRALRAGEKLQDTFTYVVSDGAGGTAQGTVTINVNGVNDGPVAVGDAYSHSEDNTLSVPRSSGVLRNDQDPEGDPLTVTLVNGPVNGSLSAFNSDGSFTYRPNPDFNGIDTFTYRANDGVSDSNLATVTVTVSPVNDSPVAVNDAYTLNQGAALSVPAVDGVLKNDTDIDGPNLTATVVRAPATGTLTLNPDGSFTYTPSPSFAGQDNFTYRASDGAGGVSNVATVTLSSTLGNPWQNPINRFDVNNDGAVSPIDVLVLVNDLNARDARPLPIPPIPPFVPPPFLDVNGDRSVTPQDALAVINHLNSGGSEGEGEPSWDAAQDSLVVDPLELPGSPVRIVWLSSSASAESDGIDSRFRGTINPITASNVTSIPAEAGDARIPICEMDEKWDDLLAILAERSVSEHETDEVIADLFGQE
jgi:VCBS repeat-containing protein